MTWKKWEKISPNWWTKFKITKPISPDWSIKSKSIRQSSTLRDKISTKLLLKWGINCMKKPTDWKTLNKQQEVSDKYRLSMRKDTLVKKIPCRKLNLSFKILNNTFLNFKQNWESKLNNSKRSNTIPKQTNIFPTKINSLEKLLPFASPKKLLNNKISSL